MRRKSFRSKRAEMVTFTDYSGRLHSVWNLTPEKARNYAEELNKIGGFYARTCLQPEYPEQIGYEVSEKELLQFLEKNKES